MADKIQIRAGNKAGMPTLADREVAYVRDEKALYIGTPVGNVKLCDADLETEVGRKLTASPVAAQSNVAEDADAAAIVAALNGLIAAMKNSGVMST